MGKGADKARDKTLAAQADTGVARLGQSTPLADAISTGALDTVNFFQGTGKYAGQPLDYTKAPGAGYVLNTYGDATAQNAAARIGNAQHAFGSGANPGFARQLDTQDKFNRWNLRAQGINQGIMDLRNNAYAQAGQANQLDLSRSNAYAQAALGEQQNFYNRPQKPPLWQTIAGLAIGGLGAAGTAGGTLGLKGL